MRQQCQKNSGMTATYVKIIRQIIRLASGEGGKTIYKMGFFLCIYKCVK
jgi:hypothetical protein